MKLKLSLTALALTGLCAHGFANGFSFGLTAGAASTEVSKNVQTVTLDTGLQNQYQDTTSQSTLNPFVGLTAAYEWNLANRPLAFSLGAGLYYTHEDITGVNSPFINAGNFDTLNYHVDASSTALMLEPKLILTAYSWQPYLLTGIGLSYNRLGNYSETPSDPNGSASPTQTPFNSHNSTSFAYEFGVGVAHPLTAKPNSATFALDWRYMNWGKASLGNFTGQTVGSAPDFGKLSSSVISLSLSWPF